MRFLPSAFLALMTSFAFAAPAPKPLIPLSVSFTQGSGVAQIIRTLPITSPNCLRAVMTPVNGPGGQLRFNLICTNGSAQGSWVQFDTSAGPVYPTYNWPAPSCGQEPPPASQPGACPPGTESHWTQTHSWTCENGTWVATPWTPVAPPLNSSCTPGGGFQWQAPFDVHTTAVPARPAKNGTYQTPYGTTVTRVTDFAAETSAQWEVSWYDRFQAVNADGTLVVFYESDGYWNLYDAHTNAFLKKLNGPGGDCEFNWDVSNPHLAYYVPTNGGTSIRQIDVVANTNSLYYDFTTPVHALWPDVSHCWTGSEGRMSMDGSVIAFKCEAVVSSNWITRGFIKISLTTKAIVWSQTNTTGDRPDNVTISPNGLWFNTQYGAPQGVKVVATDGSNRTCQLHNTVEHTGFGKLSNGHDFFITPDYTAGTIKAVDVDTCTRLDTSWPAPVSIYNNPWLFNPPSTCNNCAMHPSTNAYRKPGWVLIGFYGPYAAGKTPPANIIALNVETGQVLGLATSAAQDLDYWDEGHCSVDPDFTVAWCTENWLHSPTRDVVKITIPALPL